MPGERMKPSAAGVRRYRVETRWALREGRINDSKTTWVSIAVMKTP